MTEQQTTWADLVADEPRLRDMLAELRGMDAGAGFCASAVWYATGGPRDRLSELVGWTAEQPALRTEVAYDVAYDTLYGALPDCRHEGLC